MQLQADAIADTRQARLVAQGSAAPQGVTTGQHRQALTRAHSCQLAGSPRSRTRHNSAVWLVIYVLRRAMSALQHGHADEAGAYGLRTAAGHWYPRGKSLLWVILIDTCTTDRIV